MWLEPNEPRRLGGGMRSEKLAETRSHRALRPWEALEFILSEMSDIGGLSRGMTPLDLELLLFFF